MSSPGSEGERGRLVKRVGFLDSGGSRKRKKAYKEWVGCPFGRPTGRSERTARKKTRFRKRRFRSEKNMVRRRGGWRIHVFSIRKSRFRMTEVGVRYLILFYRISRYFSIPHLDPFHLTLGCRILLYFILSYFISSYLMALHRLKSLPRELPLLGWGRGGDW